MIYCMIAEGFHVKFKVIVHTVFACKLQRKFGYYHMNAEAYDQSEAMTPRSAD